MVKILLGVSVINKRKPFMAFGKSTSLEQGNTR